MKSLFAVLLPYGLSRIQALRIGKSWLSTLICFTLAMIDPVADKLGSAIFLIALVSVNAHPGRRVGAELETCILGIGGTVFGLAYTILCLYISQRISAVGTESQALAFLAAMETIMLFFHGFIRSYSPRMFQFVFFFFIVSHFNFLTSYGHPLSLVALSYAAPIFLGYSICLFINIIIFPEFSSTYIGTIVVSTIDDIHTHTNASVGFFIDGKQTHSDNDGGCDNKDTSTNTLASLQARRKVIRGKLSNSATALTESTFELSYAYMAPSEIEPIIDNLTVAATILNAIVGSCELEYCLLGDIGRHSKSNDEDSKTNKTKEKNASFQGHNNKNNVSTDYKQGDRKSYVPSSFKESNNSEQNKIDFDLFKSEREIEFGDKKVLINFLDSVREPVVNLNDNISDCFETIKNTITLCYDVPVEKSSYRLSIYEALPTIDEALNKIALSIHSYDSIMPEALQVVSNPSSSVETNGKNKSNYVDLLPNFMPREELFLLSSFLLNFRELAVTTCSLMSQCRDLAEVRLEREQRGWKGQKLWFPPLFTKASLFTYLSTGSSEVETSSIFTRSSHLNSNYHENSKNKRTNDLEEDVRELNKKTKTGRIRNFIADMVELPSKYGPHTRYGLKFTVCLMLVSFPAFIPQSRSWFADLRGYWVGFVGSLSLDTSIGATLSVFMLRSIGVVFGCSWGYASYAAGWSDTRGYIVITVMIAIGLVVQFYFIITSPQVLAGMVAVISSTVVVLSTIRPTTPDTILQIFAKRTIAMFLGGAVATLVQISLYPVRARDQLAKQIVLAIHYCEDIDGFISLGLNGNIPSFEQREEAYQKLNRSWARAKAALELAENYRGLTRQEPRMKGSFRERSKIYEEIIFVLHQIIDKFHNIAFLRKSYGSAVLDEMSPYVFRYRRELFGCLTTAFRAAGEALATKRPMPQFLPSSRIAHLRIVNRVREISGMETPMRPNMNESDPIPINEVPITEEQLRHKYMGWSAASSAIEEIIQYVEELTSLIKLLVGVSRFQYSFLSRSLKDEGVAAVIRGEDLESIKRDVNVTKDKSSSYTSGNVFKRAPGLRQRSFSIFSPDETMNMQLRSMAPFPASRLDTILFEDPTNDLPLSLKRVVTKTRFNRGNEKKH